MYSGITQGLFPILHVKHETGLLTYIVDLKHLSDNLIIGASVSINGVCQSVVKINSTQITFQAMEQTLKLTTLHLLKKDDLVTVERSLRVGDEIGGHECAGHIIGMGKIINLISSENNLTLSIECCQDWMKYILDKGFITINGSSLTIANINENTFDVCLIPETLKCTNFGNLILNDLVNIELDPKTVSIINTVEAYCKNL